MAVFVESVSGADIEPWLDALARLRIQVFREWPYLYDGTEEYEQQYLQKYVNSEKSVMVLAIDGDQVVGASSGLPLLDADSEFRQPFVEAGREQSFVFYFGESVLNPRYRGLGLGHRFFDERERFARENRYSFSTFCAVERPAEHPMRPSSARELTSFWLGRGYVKLPGAVAQFRWLDVGDTNESVKPMQFWGKTL
ncbi:MAG: GNAT family N-acetyltransferase [Alcanivoracaceae bacterium]|nr:GNAT family N-acetyltransferase [Alcanivoracaceae bacterium]